MATTVTSKGGYDPKSSSGIAWDQARTKVDFHRTPDGKVFLVKADGPKTLNRFQKLRGHAGKGLDTDAIMALTRGET